MEDVGLIPLISCPHPPVPAVVERGEEMERGGVDAEADQNLHMREEGFLIVLEKRAGERESQRSEYTGWVVGRNPGADPVAFGVPPDILLSEPPLLVMRIEDKPEVVPQHAPRKVHRPALALLSDRPLHAHREMRVENEDGQEEHKHVVARQRLAAHDQAIQPGRKSGHPVPGGHFFSPSMLALCLDLHAGQESGEERPEKDAEDDHDRPRRGRGDVGNRQKRITEKYCFVTVLGSVWCT